MGAGILFMNIYAFSVSNETCDYIAVSTTDPSIIARSYTSTSEAVGKLVTDNPGITIDKITFVEWPK